ncbi:A-factor barrier protein 1 [Monosporozyma servazzii]
MSLKALIIPTLLALGSASTPKIEDPFRNAAAEADMPFFEAFLNDFDVNLAQYTSYMMQNHITLPQAIADYYYHLAPMATDIDLQSDIAQTFPFTEFQTFVTAFPWYSSLLSDSGVSTIYLPDYYKSMDVGVVSTSPEAPSSKQTMVKSTTIQSSVTVSASNTRTSTEISSSITETNTLSIIPSSSSSSSSSTIQKSKTSEVATSIKSTHSSATSLSKNDSNIMNQSLFSLYICLILGMLPFF